MINSYFLHRVVSALRTGLIVLGISLGVGSASAKTIVAPNPPNVNVIPLFDPRLDFALRIEAINRAKVSIDVVVYLHTGELGIAMNEALQAAINRGVKVRFITEGLTSVGPTKPLGSNLPGKLLKTLASNAECVGEVNCLTPLSKIKAGYHPFDSFHEKILIVDGGTKNEVAWLGGRNNDKFALGDLDFSVVMRRIDGLQKSAIAALQSIFDEIWLEAAKMQKPMETKVAASKAELLRKTVISPDPRKIIEPSAFTTKDEYNAHLTAVFGDSPRGSMVAFEDAAHGIGVFQPEHIAFSSNEFFQQLSDQGAVRAMSKRTGIKNSNFELMRESVLKSKRIYVTSMAVDMPEEFSALLKEALDGGTEVVFVTNSPELEKARIPMGIQFDRSMAELQKLFEHTKQPGVKGSLEIFLLDKEKIANNPDYAQWLKYIHRKMLLTDHGVFLGSDNYTDASRARNSEILGFFRDRKFVKYMAGRMSRELGLFRPMPCTDLMSHAVRSREWVRQVFGRVLRQFL